jgi:hypothetical protein
MSGYFRVPWWNPSTWFSKSASVPGEDQQDLQSASNIWKVYITIIIVMLIVCVYHINVAGFKSSYENFKTKASAFLPG